MLGKAKTVGVSACLLLAVATFVPTGAASYGERERALEELMFAPRQAESTNWSGYFLDGGTFNQVSARWSQPEVTCSSEEPSASGFWVGLDGSASSSVEQVGTLVACLEGRPTYAAFYELYPAPVHYLSSPVSPRDSLVATVSALADGSFSLTLVNDTQGWRFETVEHAPQAERISAEVIAERPSSSAGPWPLADFGSVAFQEASANGRPLAASHPVRVVMSDGHDVTRAEPSALAAGDFSVGWQHG